MTQEQQNNDLKSYYLRQLRKGNITQKTYDNILDWIEKQEDWKDFPRYKKDNES